MTVAAVYNDQSNTSPAVLTAVLMKEEGEVQEHNVPCSVKGKDQLKSWSWVRFFFFFFFFAAVAFASKE